jgi:hypothetical protein
VQVRVLSGAQHELDIRDLNARDVEIKKVAQGVDKHELVVYIETTIIKSDHLFF